MEPLLLQLGHARRQGVLQVNQGGFGQHSSEDLRERFLLVSASRAASLLLQLDTHPYQSPYGLLTPDFLRPEFVHKGLCMMSVLPFPSICIGWVLRHKVPFRRDRDDGTLSHSQDLSFPCDVGLDCPTSGHSRSRS